MARVYRGGASAEAYALRDTTGEAQAQGGVRLDHETEVGDDTWAPLTEREKEKGTQAESWRIGPGKENWAGTKGREKEMGWVRREKGKEKGKEIARLVIPVADVEERGKEIFRERVVHSSPGRSQEMRRKVTQHPI